LHYCVEDLDLYQNKIDAKEDFMSSDANFNKYLPLIMATPPADSKICGLEYFKNEMP